MHYPWTGLSAFITAEFLSIIFKAPHAQFLMFLYLFGTDAQIQIPQRASNVTGNGAC